MSKYNLKFRNILRGLAVAMSITGISAAAPSAMAQSIVNYGPAPRLIDVTANVLFGGSTITENYMNCFPEIREMNTSPGTSLGIGLSGVLGLRDWLGVGTEFNLMINNYRTDLAVSNDEATSMSNVFLRNHVYYVTIPFYAQFRFNVAQYIRWTIDGGLYYSYGIGGSQKQSIYHSQINSLGQLVPTNITVEPHYFNDSGTFIHSNHRGDVGVHLATALRFRYGVSFGAVIQLGLKNIAYSPNGSSTVNPNVHNVSYRIKVGYTF